MNKIAVVFIHGLKGNSETWVNESGESLQKLLCENDAEIAEYCDFYEYNYFSKLIEFMNGFIAKQSFGFMKKIPLLNRFGGKSKTRKVKKNKTIEHLSSGLESELRVRFSEHKEIILIGHSMGGLVAKNLILSQFRSGNINNIKAYISMATPHHGSLQAMFLQASRNVHIKELQPLNEQTMKLDNEWGRNKKQLPSSLYIVGLDDEVVLPHCAIPNGADDSQIYKLNDVDHTHICKPENIECLSYILVKKLIKERVSGIVINNNYEDKKKRI